MFKTKHVYKGTDFSWGRLHRDFKLGSVYKQLDDIKMEPSFYNIRNVMGRKHGFIYFSKRVWLYVF